MLVFLGTGMQLKYFIFELNENVMPSIKTHVHLLL